MARKIARRKTKQWDAEDADYSADGIRPASLSITHNLLVQFDAEAQAVQSGEPAPDDHVAGRWVMLSG